MILRVAMTAAAALVCATGVLAADPNDALSDALDGATCDYYNRGAGGLWQRRGGDWTDATGKPYGEAAYGSATVGAEANGASVDVDVTRLVADWSAGRQDSAHGLMLRGVGDRQGISVIASKESGNAARRPVLAVEFDDGTRRSLDVAADTYLDCTTEKGLGSEGRVNAGRGFNAVMRFDLPRDADWKRMTRAVLRLVVIKQYGGAGTLGAFAVTPPPSPDASARQGIAAGYPGDQGIGNDRDVWFATGFERFDWPLEWGDYDPRSDATAIYKDPDRRFVPISGKALSVRMRKGKNIGLDLRYLFRTQAGSEPEEAYFRYYLRLGDDWSPDVDGGKLPGFAGTYGRAGWGLRRSTGTDGWSMRGSFYIRASAANTYHDHASIGTYAYHVDIQESSGEEWRWPLGRLAALEKNRWYCIEQFFKVNTPDKHDGVMRAWIDGRLAFERTNIRVRTTPDLRIESVWFNVYHGGTTPSPRDMHLYIDNVVIARKYIGPLARAH